MHKPKENFSIMDIVFPANRCWVRKALLRMRILCMLKLLMIQVLFAAGNSVFHEQLVCFGYKF